MTDSDRLLHKHSFVELGARQRARALLDAGSFRELLDPFQRVMSPWLARQGVVPQADDGHQLFGVTHQRAHGAFFFLDLDLLERLGLLHAATQPQRDHGADQSADDADHGALHHEDRHDLPRRGAESTQDGDIALLVVHHHHQRGDDVERRHGDDQQQQQADHGFFHADGLVQVAVGASPVTGVILALAQLLGDFPGSARRLEQVIELQPQPLYLIRFPALQARQVLQVGDTQVAVDLTGADMKNALHGKTLHAREHAGRCHRDFRRNEGQLVANAHTELFRRLVTDDDAEAAWGQRVELALLHKLVNDRDIALLRRVDGIEQDFLHIAIIGQQALHLGKGGYRLDLGVLLDLRGQTLPVADRLIADDGRVRHHAQHAGAHLMIETVHDRKHDNHHDHAKGEPDHRSQGNKRHKMIATLCTGITRANK